MARKERSVSLPKIGILGDALGPYFNEAYANQMRLLSEQLNAPVLTCHDIGFAPWKRMGNYFIVNGRFLRESSPRPLLFLLNGVLFYSFLKLFERKHNPILLSGGINSGFLRRLKLEKCILLINTLPFSEESAETRYFMQNFAPRLKGVVAQSKRIESSLLEMGVEAQKVRLVYPWVDMNRFRPTEPPQLDELRLLFASSPNAEIPGENIFEEKGVPLLLETFREFVVNNKASLCLLWRGHYNSQLTEKIMELGLSNQVKVINEVVDMPNFYAQSHITVIPFLNTRRSPEIPLSAVESLASGRPVVTTDVAEISETVREYQCGCVAKPTKDSLLTALLECQRNYRVNQANCRKVAEELFALNSKRLLEGLSLNSGQPAQTKFNIVVVTVPVDNVPGEVNLTSVLRPLEPISNTVFAITGSLPEYVNTKIKIIRLKGRYIEDEPVLARVLNHILTDLRISFSLMQILSNVDIVAFHIGARCYLLSAFLSKMLGKKMVAFSFSTASKLLEASTRLKEPKKSRVVSGLLATILEKCVLALADQIAVESESVIKFSGLERFRNKIAVYGAQYMDFNLFKENKRLIDRRKLVGYIGSLVELKGVMELAQAIPLVLKEESQVEFLIAGDGPLYTRVRETLKAQGVLDRVELTGWVAHDEVADYLNELRLLVLPSYSEGIPGIVQEAMACGTPVLATPVGGVPDLIKDGETGFIIEDNSPDVIATNVLRALQYPRLDKITQNARQLVERHYTYEVMAEQFKSALTELMKGRK